MIKNLLAVGDFITLRVDNCMGKSYPELIGKRLGCAVTKQECTMPTSREGVHLLSDSLKVGHDFVIIQFGDADIHLCHFTCLTVLIPTISIRSISGDVRVDFKKAIFHLILGN